jgi:fatty acid desaturase
MPRLEFVLGCLLSWPMAWPYVTYSRLHQLHHRWNGSDPRDPERTEPLAAERERASPRRRWLQRHPLLWRALGLGGLGLIADTAWKGWALRQCDPALRSARQVDGLGVVLVQSGLLVLAMAQGVVGRYLVFWLILERVIGAVLQSRGLIEHHGLWRREASHLLTQLYATRNVTGGAWLNALMGGLPHHSAHHAFPWIPSQRLPEASARIAAVLRRYRLPPLPAAAGYPSALLPLL